MTEILREPGRVANGLSTITARLTKKNDEYIASITGGMGIIDKNTGELRSTFDILQDLSKAWTHLTSVEKQELAETVAGKTQRSLFTALMTNFESAVGATETALNSEGSAMEENAKRMNSLQGKVEQLKSAWQSFAKNSLDSDLVKNILTTTTNVVKLVDKLGGLKPILLSILGLVITFKAQKIGKSVELIWNNIISLVNGLKIFKQHMFGATNANVIYMGSAEGAKVATTGLTAAVSALNVALGLGTLVFTGIASAISFYKQKQEEANNAALESSRDAEKVIDKKTEEKNKIQENIDKLNEEKEEYKQNAKAKGNEADNKSFIEAKDKEIEKRRENIKAIDEEIEKSWQNREAAARSLKPPTADLTGLGVPVYNPANYRELEGITKVNAELQKANGNAGAYNRILEEQRRKYEEIAQAREKNGLDAEQETNIINRITKEIEDNSNKYSQAKDMADEYYALLLNGRYVTEENAKWLKEFNGYTEEQMADLKDGIDIKIQDAEATDNQNQALSLQEEYLQGVVQEEEERLAQARERLEFSEEELSNINEEIDNLQSAYSTLTTAVDEYNDAGGISMDTLQELLALDGDYLNSLELVNGKLQISKQAQELHAQKVQQDTLALIENAAMEDLQAQATANAGSVASAASSKIYDIGENAKKAGDYAKEGASGFVELAGAMAQAGMVDLNGVDVNAWSNKWAGITDKIKGLTAGTKLTSSKFTGGSSKSSRGSRGGSRSKKPERKPKEEYKATIDTLYNYKNALENAKNEVGRLNDALKQTDNFNEQEKYTRKLVDATNEQINKTNDLRNAQVRQMEDYINQLRAQGFAIDYNSSKNELFINNMQHLADFSGDTAKRLEKLIKETQKLNKDNLKLDDSVRNLKGDIKKYYDTLGEFPEEKLKKFKELMDEFQQSQLQQVENQVKDLQKQMENDPRLQQLEKQIDALEKQNDKIDKQKEMEEKILAVEEAKIKLQNAQKQRNIQVYRKGQGFVWEADFGAIEEAQKDLKETQENLNDKIKQDQIDQLKAEKEALEKSYQDRIDKLEKFLDDQNYLIEKANREGIKTFQELQKELAKFGLDSSENLKKATDWINNYNQALNQLKGTMDSVIGAPKADELIYSSAMQNRINQAMSSSPMNSTPVGFSINGLGYNTIGKGGNSQNIYIENIELPNVSNANEFVEALKNLPRLASSEATRQK